MSKPQPQPQPQREFEYKNASDWEIDLDNRYTEEEVDSIMNMLSYWDNKRRGFGHKNDEELYMQERTDDINNILYEEAMYGLSLMKERPPKSKPRGK